MWSGDNIVKWCDEFVRALVESTSYKLQASVVGVEGLDRPQLVS